MSLPLEPVILEAEGSKDNPVTWRWKLVTSAFWADVSLLKKKSVFPIAFPALTDLLRPVVWMVTEIVLMTKWDPSLLWNTQNCSPLLARSQIKPVSCSPVASYTLVICKAEEIGHLWESMLFTVSFDQLPVCWEAERPLFITVPQAVGESRWRKGKIGLHGDSWLGMVSVQKA